MRRVLFFLSAFLLCLPVVAQENGALSGVVVSAWDGSTLPGVIITVRGTTLAGQTDQNGRYQINTVAIGDHVVRFSKPGFASAVVTDVRVLPGQTTTVNGNLRPEFFEMEEYEVTAEEFTEQSEKIIFERQQASSMLDAIGSEQFSRLGASDASAIVSRVTGVSIVGGKYAVVRGLSDRYIRTQLNGLDVPSSDPYRSSPPLDLFPSGMIDRINISKTFTPDQPGGSAGGTIDIRTKPFPEKAFVKASFGQSYNPNSNLRDDFLADPKTSLSIVRAPEGPLDLKAPLWELRQIPPTPLNAVSSETQTRAETRRNQADAYAALLQDLGTTDFGGVEKSSPLNTSFSASGGDTRQVFGRALGMFAGINYARNYQLLDDFTVARYSGIGAELRAGTETRGNIKTDFGANVNLGYRLSDTTELGFNFMLADSTDEEARHITWTRSQNNPEGYLLEQWQLHHTSRQVQNFQLHGHHTLPNLGESELDWGASLANTTQDEPDHRFMNYSVDPSGQVSLGVQDIVPFFPSRYYRKIDDESLNLRGDWKFPLEALGEQSFFKFGVFNSTTDRNFREQYFTYQGIEGFNGADPNSYLNDPAYLEYVASPLGGRRTNYNFMRMFQSVNGNPYTASQSIIAAYPMADLNILPRLRVIGGARVEDTDMQIRVRDQSEIGLDQTDILPSASLVYTIITNVNLRLSYGDTVARPSFREKAPISNYLPDRDLFADGNPELQMSSIRSYDARIEWFPNPGEIISAGVFYKNIQNAIELGFLDIDKSVTWFNRDEAKVMGIEFEARKSLGFILDDLQGLTLGANVAIIQSETEFTQEELDNKNNEFFQADSSRPLYDQSPYIINLDLTYEQPKWGTVMTVAANMIGPRIVLTQAQGPDLYEHSPVSLDAALSQKLGKHWTVRFGVRNILDPIIRETWGEKFDDNLRQSFRRGRTFSLSLTADF